MVAFFIAGYSPFRRARRPLGAVVLLTSLLVVPLGLSLVRLVRQNQLEANVKRALVQDTETFRSIELVSSRTNWQLPVAEVRMVVNASQPITSRQVELLENYILRRMDRQFHFVFQVSQIQEVTREEIADSPTIRGTTEAIPR